MEVLSLFVDVQVVLISDEYFVCSVECSHTTCVDFIGVADVDAVEIEAEQQSDADCGAVHDASVELVLLAVVQQSGIDVASPELQVGAYHRIQGQFVSGLTEGEVVSSLHHDCRIYRHFMQLVVAQLDGRAEQMGGAHAGIPELLVGVAESDIEVECVAFYVVLCEGGVVRFG